ncbi:MAG TPA: N-acetylmuramoyl-L-alanine amidase [Thermoanaerobaculia bacterium]
MFGDTRRVKRRLVRELVEENVELRAGGRPRPRPRRRLRRALKVLAFLVAPTAVLASSLVLSGAVTPERRPAPAARAAPAALEPATPAPVAPAPAESILPAGLPGAPVEAAPATPPAPSVSTDPVNADVFPLAVRRIVLDPGHGGANTGTRTPGGLEEKDLTLEIARRVRDTLARHPYEVLLTREGDEAVTLDERAAFANRARADIFVSIHVNWFEGVRGSGIETYYLGPTDDPFLTRLAAAENRESGHTLAEMRQLLDRIYAGVRQDKSQNLARELHGALFRSLSRVNPRLTDRGVKTAPFLVLVDTEMPAILAEVAALSSEAEAAMLEKPLYRDYIADSLAAGIVAYAESVADRASLEGAPKRGAERTLSP